MGRGGEGGGRRRVSGGRRRVAGGGAATEATKMDDSIFTSPGASYAKRFEEDPNVNPGGVLTGPGKLIEDMTPEESAAIEAYTGAHVAGGERFRGLNAEKINRAIYDPAGFEKTLRMAGEPEAVIADYVKRAKDYRMELEGALKKLKNFEGETYRTVSDPLGKMADKYVPGETITMDGFVSTSRTYRSSYKAFATSPSGTTRYIIQSKTGKAIEKKSQFLEEREVLFGTGTSFQVMSKTFNKGRKTWDIVLREN